MSDTILEVKDLSKNYGTYQAVKGISFSIKRGEVLGLLGPNGAGKSTTIQMLVGITLPNGGSIRYFDMDFSKHRQDCLQRINFASAYNTLQGRIQVGENLNIFAALYGVIKPQKKIAGLVEYFEVAHLMKHRYWDLSAGERTRVNLVKALINDPELILMDEPTASLDPDIADKTLSLIEDLRTKRNLSILFTSHNMSEVSRICDEVIFLDKGTIVSQDTPSNHTKQIGGSKLVLQFSGKKTKLDEILKSTKLHFDFLPDNRVNIKISGNEIADVITKVREAGIQITDVEIEKADLQDVFLEIARRKR